MLDSVKIQKRQSEIRQALSELVGKAGPSDDETRQMETLDGEYCQNEPAIARRRRPRTASGDRPAMNWKPAPTGSLPSWWQASSCGRSPLPWTRAALTGQTAEVVQEMRNAGGYQGIPVPLAALETRAGETIAADVPNPKTIRPIIDRLFPGSVAARLGIQRINIEKGEVAFPVATDGAVFGWQTTELGNVGAAHEFKTAERSLNPDHTGGAQMILSRKALKQSGKGLEAAIRRDLNAAIGAELDRVVINGSDLLGEPLGIVPGAATYSIPMTGVGAAAS